MPEDFKSGIISVVGRPNVGKSTLINALVGTDISIASSHPHTTRRQIRAIYNDESTQMIFVDTPGIHKPHSALSDRMNEAAYNSLEGVDIVIFVLDASGPVGKGDAFIAEHVSKHKKLYVVVNKCDVAKDETKIAEILQNANQLLPNAKAIIPVSAFTSKNIHLLFNELISELEVGPAFFDVNALSDMTDEQLVAEMYREQLLHRLRQELPQSVAVVAKEEEPIGDKRHFELRVIVAKSSHKPMVIGKKGSMIEVVGTKARVRLEKILGSELVIKARVDVDEQWQSRGETLDSYYL